MQQEVPLRAHTPGQLANHLEFVCYLPLWQLVRDFCPSLKGNSYDCLCLKVLTGTWTFPLLHLLFSLCGRIVSPSAIPPAPNIPHI